MNKILREEGRLGCRTERFGRGFIFVFTSGIQESSITQNTKIGIY